MTEHTDDVSLTTSPSEDHEQHKLVGVIGGLGPEATIDFMSRVMANTPATIDQDHVQMLVYHDPKIPSRQCAIRGEGESCGPRLAALASRLEQAGVDFIVMPCNLGHFWEREMNSAIDIPLVSIIDVTVAAALRQCRDEDTFAPIGLFTTPGCFYADLYQQALQKTKHPVILQTPHELKETMYWVERIKAGDKSESVAKGMKRMADALISRGAKVLIAACTEIPLVLNEDMFHVPFVSSTDELAKHTVALALGHSEQDV